jgi:hypothetical protein
MLIGDPDFSISDPESRGQKRTGFQNRSTDRRNKLLALEDEMLF